MILLEISGKICYDTIVYMGWGIYILFALEIMEGGLDYGKRKCTIIVGLARQEHSAVFSVCQVLFHTIYNEPVAEDMEHYALSSAFCVC